MDSWIASMFRLIGGMRQAMVAWMAALITGYGVYVRLLTGPVPIVYGTQWDPTQEATFGGYAPVQVTSFSGPFLDSSPQYYATGPLALFSGDGTNGTNNITAAVLVGQIPGSTQATGTVTTTAGVVSAPVITAGGAGYLVAPAVQVLGGGTGAVITATVSGGVVTALTLVSGGTGYTDATIVIDPPLQIVAAYNFPLAVNVGSVDSALPVVPQVNMGA